MNDESLEQQQHDTTTEEHDVLVLTSEESVWFINILMQPAREPSEALLRAAQRHCELFGKSFDHDR